MFWDLGVRVIESAETTRIRSEVKEGIWPPAWGPAWGPASGSGSASRPAGVWFCFCCLLLLSASAFCDWLLKESCQSHCYRNGPSA